MLLNHMENLIQLVHSSSESNDASTRNITLKLYNALLVCWKYNALVCTYVTCYNWYLGIYTCKYAIYRDAFKLWLTITYVATVSVQ